MKFAKELERDAVPEWRIKYLNYKAGKKYVKAVARAVQRVSATPHHVTERTPSFYTAQSSHPTPHHGTRRRREEDQDEDDDEDDGFVERVESDGHVDPRVSRPVTENEALTSQDDGRQYGSITPTPVPSPKTRHDPDGAAGRPFELPAPAMLPGADVQDSRRPTDSMRKTLQHMAMAKRRASTGAVALAQRNKAGTRSSHPDRGHLHMNSPGTAATAQHVTPSPPQLRRLFSYGATFHARRSPSRTDVGLSNIPFDLVREREVEFYAFMDSELDKVESFYRMKEEQAGRRLALLREQLREMRNRRVHEIAESARHRKDPHNQQPSSAGGGSHQGGPDQGRGSGNGWVRPIKDKMFPPGPNSKGFGAMPHTPHMAGGSAAAGEHPSRDYVRRPSEDQDVSYRTAKHKLKLAIHEFYRGLELLKAYALLNRTAFRKLNKKYDKVVHTRPPYRYMNERVNKAWFVTSDVLDGHIRAVESLYARYFERGNQKLAAGKLRSLIRRHDGDHSGSTFQSGFLLGTGLVFAVQGAIHGARLLLTHPDPEFRARTGYLLQVYGGYFLMLLLFFLFCLDCMIWSRSRINYPFIFELDQRHHLDWRALAAFPSFFLLLFGVVIWANFSMYGPDELYLYYPVILIGLTAVIILLPFPILAHRARKWLAYSHWRLLLAGIYPVEFRDFFLGDMYCSLTYATANIELFFCLYAREWENPVQCNSNHSRLMGFLAALPPIWRFLQCIRRYHDTRNIFPHLVNCGKYTMTIMSAVALSLYRIRGTQGNLALFITFSLINSVYCSIWDLFMDFSLVQAESKHFALRDILGLKSRWPYYSVMVADPILRFAWIFYAIFTHNRQHSTLVSFLVGLAEVLRRGVWALFRVENEHCANVAQYKASRDVPLPYRIEPLLASERTSASASEESSPAEEAGQQQQQQQQQQAHPDTRRHSIDEEAEQGRLGTAASSTAVAPSTTAIPIGSGVPGGGRMTLRRRTDTTTTGRSFSRILAEAHKQDFEKRRRTPAEQAVEDRGHHGGAHDDDDDDEEEEEEDVEEEQALEENELEEHRRIETEGRN